ncbi:1-aminocyclopropane-1-carboxylate deaminase/D-cysteine desulfhydrase [Vibrio hepatarius]|uniref:1-aminocyclopropane-1-carboxylate deaminase/D-cysteine desulfhydrase n=1 Tax=Vibrio hepatarius TaxID=171383 RepID=UPI001C09E2A6|nr:1-aminocyclopropane-1-carboxylate deaminase/D-cysteine desulfhydrase [Vibrio hepatarius]MBU2897833.1 1-aminocyclopropane-1-carboxylate deaminase/D-cysteine desulfhydrase [Vibrio hepatarius]
MQLNDSPITTHTFEGIEFFLKRDDLLHPQFSGNKARKFMSLLQNEQPQIKTVISYGSPQANSLYSLAALCALKSWTLEFYVDRIPNWLRDKPMGNYRGALELGAKIIAVNNQTSHPTQFIQHIRCPDSSCIVLEEGGREQQAQIGIKELAEEIRGWVYSQANKNVVVALPSGTGTTSAYLEHFLKPHKIDVITCPCVGGRDYLVEQIRSLEIQCLPQILQLKNKHHFGKLYYNDYKIWAALLEQTQVEFDLLYDPMMWQCLLDWYPRNADKSVLYIHQGGVLGNESMLPRYLRKFGSFKP